MSEETTHPHVTLGQTLANARLAKNLSIEFIGEQLKITPAQIARIESDDYLGLGPETFVRGYIKGYCRLVELDSVSIFELYVGPPAPEKSRRMKSFSRRTEKEAHDNRLMWVSYLILALVIGSSIFWWWQTTSTQNEVNVVTSSVIEAATVSQDNELLATEPSEVSNDVVTENFVSESQVTPATSEADEPAPILAANPVADVNEASKPQNNSIARPALSTIEMQFGEDSWVEVFDATSERIAFGIKKAGYKMTVAGKAPFSVVLAKHQKVVVSLDGEPVDLSYLPKNKLAKFKLPLAE